MKKINWLKEKTREDAVVFSRRFWSHLSEHAYPLSKGAMKIPISLEPYALSHQKYHDLHEQVSLLISAAKKMAEEFYNDKKLEEVFAIDQHEQALIHQAKEDPMIGIVRVDLFYGDTPKVVEINADFPDGFFMHDITANAIKNLPIGYELQTASNTDLFVELLKSEGVGPNDHIFVGYNGDRQFLDEFALTKIKLHEAGWSNVSVGAFENLYYENGTFYFNGQQVHVIRRGAELSKLRLLPLLFDQLAEAKRVSGLKIINPLKMRLLGHKSLLAALHDKRFAKYLTAKELAAVVALVPETRKLDEADIPTIREEKNRWVLKPSDLAEGSGVAIGSSLSLEDWTTALSVASREPAKWVLQEKIDIPQQSFTLLDGDTHQQVSIDAYYDLDPHIVLFRDQSKFGNILVRFSGSEILNVMKGGGLTYAFHQKEK